jgi:hypothetical protein
VTVLPPLTVPVADRAVYPGDEPGAFTFPGRAAVPLKEASICTHRGRATVPADPIAR